MAQAKYVQKGNSIDYRNDTQQPIQYLQVVALASCVAVALDIIQPGETGTVALTEAYEFPAAAQAVAVGDTVYWDATNEAMTTEAEGNIRAGIAITEKPGEAAGIITVRLCPGTAELTLPAAGG